MIEISHLREVSVKELFDTFNLSFSDYLVPLSLTYEQFQRKLDSENVNLDYSVGAFESGRLVGFVLHFYHEANGRKILYNGATGVIPAHRGQSLTSKMYQYMLLLLRKQGVSSIQLEVLAHNYPAIHIYEKIGFGIARQLKCYRGESMIENTHVPYIHIEPLSGFVWDIWARFWDFEPTWQNSNQVIERLSSSIKAFGAHHGSTMVGYIIYNTQANRIHQLAVDPVYRRMRIGEMLVQHVVQMYGANLSVINVDAGSVSTMHFLTRLGLENFIDQIDMRMRL
ncbi:MAG: GNAT family N-acetyltransferase [Breznakibacter sp.]